MIKDIFFSFSFQVSVHLECTFIRTKGDKNSEILKKKTKKETGTWHIAVNFSLEIADVFTWHIDIVCTEKTYR